MKLLLFLSAILFALVVFIPVQHYVSIKTEPVPPQQGGPLHTDYSNGTRRVYQFDGSYILSSELINTATGNVLSKSLYEAKLIDGKYRLVVAKRFDYTLWGRTKTYVFAAAVVGLVFALLGLKTSLNRRKAGL